MEAQKSVSPQEGTRISKMQRTSARVEIQQIVESMPGRTMAKAFDLDSRSNAGVVATD